MFNRYKMNEGIHIAAKTPNKPYYHISKSTVINLSERIMKEEKQLISKGFLQEIKDDKVGKKKKVTISIDEQIETTHEFDDQDLFQQVNKQKILVNNDCLSTPAINVDQNEDMKEDATTNAETAEQTMQNYKINRQKYHSFCQNQALKEEQAKKRQRQKKILNRRQGQNQQKQEKRMSKIKTWKAEAASTKRILSSTNMPNQKSTQSTTQPIIKDSMTVITKLSIVSMYQLTPAQINNVGYAPSANQDAFFLVVYEAVKTDMQYARIYKLRETNLSKIRTFIVRRVLDDFVAQRFEDSPEQRQHLARHNRRITRFDRSRYMQAGINQPPSRMKSHYLQQIFQNQEFRNYYINYLSSQRLRAYMIETNQEMADKYWQQVTSIARRDIPLQQKITIFKEIKRKPLFLTQIVEYLEEANMIRIQYCKERPKKIPASQ